MKRVQFVVFVFLWIACVPALDAAAQGVSDSSIDADKAAVLKLVLQDLVSQRDAKQPAVPLNISRGTLDAKLFPAKIGEVEIALVKVEEIEKQESFVYFEFDTFRIRKSGVVVVLIRVVQSCSGYSDRNRFVYDYKKVNAGWEGSWSREFESFSDGPSPCKKK